MFNQRGGSTPGYALAGFVGSFLLLGSAPLHAQHFTDVTGAAGIGNEYYETQNHHGLGVIWIDFDEDGWPDLLATNGQGNPPHLYQNNGDGTFALADDLLPALPDYEYMGAVYADYDNDGDSDIYLYTDHEQVFNPGDGPPNLLLKNLFVENGGMVEPGVPLFEEVAEAAGVEEQLDDPPQGDYGGSRTTTAAWIDYNRDSYTDLVVCHWVIPQLEHPAAQNRIYLNNGDGSFTEVTDTCGIYNAEATHPRNTLASFAGHLDQDLWPDLYVINVDGRSPSHHDVYYRNMMDSTFLDVTADSPGIGDDAGAGMGATAGDIDLDGDWDFYMSDLWDTGIDALPLGNPLYLNNGDGTFADNSADVAGVQGDNSWGVNFFDADQDGYEDLFVAVILFEDFFYHNDQDGTFSDLSQEAGVYTSGNGRGSAVADYDGDGDLDLVVTYHQGNLRLFQNNYPGQGNWLQVKLDATLSNRDAIGSVVRVSAGGLQMMRQVLGGTSAHSQDSLVVHFGMGAATTADSIEVLWPSGVVDVMTDVASNQVVVIKECIIDLDGNGAVGTADLLTLLNEWGTNLGGPPDFNGDGNVGTADLLMLLEAWGSCV
jgi:hypothetical protein